MPDNEELFEEVAKIVQDRINAYLNETVDGVNKRIEEFRSEMENKINTIKEEKTNAVSQAIEEKVNVEDIANQTKEESDTISKNKVDELVAELDKLIKEKVDAHNDEFENIITKSLKSRDTGEKITKEIVSWIEEHKDYLGDILSERVKFIIEEKKEKDIIKNVEEFVKAPEFKDMVKLSFMNWISNSKEAFTGVAREVLEAEINKEKDRIIKNALKDVSSTIKESVNASIEKELKENIDKIVQDIKSQLDDINARIAQLSKGAAPSEPATEEKNEEAQADIEFDENAEQNLENLAGEDTGVEVQEEEAEKEEEQVTVEEEKPEEAVVSIEAKERGIRLKSAINIKYYGHSAFLLESNGVKIITDPYKKGALDGAINYEPIEDVADIVTVSHGHMDHAGWKEIPGEPTLVEAAGEKVVKGIKFKGIPAFHDKAHGQLRGSIMIFSMQLSGANIVHLGDLGHVLTPEQIKEIGVVDILMLPVGGYFTIDAEDAWHVANQLNPIVIMPIHYKTEKVDLPISDLEPFLSTAPSDYAVKRFNSSVVEFDRLPNKPTIWILDPANI